MIPTLYAASVVPLSDEELYAKAWNVATPKRKEKADRYHFERDRRLSLGAELLLRHALSEAGEIMPDTFLTGEQGKPALPGGSLKFNLSHSGDWVLCALGESEVGCDVEKIGKANLAIAGRFFCRSEYEYVASGENEEEQALRFARMWTLKESYVKNLGLGLKLPFNEFEIALGNCVTVYRTSDDQKYRFCEFDDIPGYRCALCAVEDRCDPRLHVVDLRAVL